MTTIQALRTEILSSVAGGFPVSTGGNAIYPLSFKITLAQYNELTASKGALSADESTFRLKLANTPLISFVKGTPRWSTCAKRWFQQYKQGTLSMDNTYSVSARLAKATKKSELSPSELLAKRLAELKAEVEAVTEEHKAALELATKLENKRESLKAAMVSVMEDYVATI